MFAESTHGLGRLVNLRVRLQHLELVLGQALEKNPAAEVVRELMREDPYLRRKVERIHKSTNHATPSG